MSVFIGLDVSSVVLGAVAITPNGGTRLWAFPLSKNHAQGSYEAFCGMHTVIDECTKEDWGDIHVFMEEPFVFAGRPGATIPQAHCQGGVMAAAWQQEVNFTQINNKTVKASIVGNGNAKKEEVTEKMGEIWPALVKMSEAYGKFQQDVVDAGMIAMYAKKSVQLRERLTKQRAKKG